MNLCYKANNSIIPLSKTIYIGENLPGRKGEIQPTDNT